MPRNSHIESRMFRAFHNPTRTSEKTNFDSLAAHNHPTSIILRLPPHCARCSFTAVQHGIRVSTWYDIITVLPKWTDRHVLPARDMATARDITDAGPSPTYSRAFFYPCAGRLFSTSSAFTNPNHHHAAHHHHLSPPRPRHPHLGSPLPFPTAPPRPHVFEPAQNRGRNVRFPQLCPPNYSPF